MTRVDFLGGAAIIALAVASIASAAATDADENTFVEPNAGETAAAQPLAPFAADTLFSQSVLDPNYGNLDAFYGNLNAFYGKLNAFYGSLDAFYGNLNAFYGSLDAFGGDLNALYGSLSAFYGALDAFYGKLDAFYGSLNTFAGDPAQLKAELDALFTEAATRFGSAVTQEGSGDFHASVAAPLLAKYGIDGATFAGAEHLTRDQYAAFVLEFHDTVMQYSGLDQYDHWMATVNWSPALAQSANSGLDVSVGVLDTRLLNEDLIGGDLEGVEGYNIDGQSHGAAVASLIAAAHDGRGVMGIAPDVELFVSNPFDTTHTATWMDVRDGLTSLGASGVSVVNVSLGVSGWTLNPEWASEVFARTSVQQSLANTVFVKAAGNNGLAQHVDIDWTNVVGTSNALGADDVHERLLIVGSVDTNGDISSFSNTPGDACLLVNNQCGAGFRLMDRFLVAPGELMLVGDNAGGVSRATGTSFAAPLVTGAVALVQSRWGWLKNHTAETADIILLSAQDLGAPGVDAVYGHGLLDIDAALSPLDPTALTINVGGAEHSLLQAGGLTPAALARFDTSATITAFEVIGDTYRDFSVSIASLGLSTADPSAAADQNVQSYLDSMATALPASNDDDDDDNEDDFDDFALTSEKTIRSFAFGNKDAQWSARFTATQRDWQEIVAVDAAPFQMSAKLKNNANGLTLRFGQGQGALAFSSGSAFGMASDHDLETGGVNPFLGLASGDFFASTSYPLTERLTMSFDFTQDTDRQAYIDADSGEMRELYTGVDDYSAAAVNLEFNYRVSQFVDVTAGYTQLHETTGLLGVQGAGLFSLSGGAATDALTLGANVDLARGLSVSTSATVGNTRSAAFDNSVLSIGDGGVTSTAFQIAALKHGVFSKTDKLRLSLSQPLHLETGTFGVTSMQVVDRETGEIDLVTSDVAFNSGNRRFVSDLVYTAAALEDWIAVSAFSRVELNNRDLGFEQTAVSGGGRVEVRF